MFTALGHACAQSTSGRRASPERRIDGIAESGP